MKYDVRHMEAGENKEGLKSWLKYVSKFLKALVSGDGNDDDSDVVDNSSEGPPQELLRLQAEYSKIEEAHIAQGLDEMIIDDTSALIQVIQHDGVYGQARLELVSVPHWRSMHDQLTTVTVSSATHLRMAWQAPANHHHCPEYEPE